MVSSGAWGRGWGWGTGDWGSLRSWVSGPDQCVARWQVYPSRLHLFGIAERGELICVNRVPSRHLASRKKF